MQNWRLIQQQPLRGIFKIPDCLVQKGQIPKGYNRQSKSVTAYYIMDGSGAGLSPHCIIFSVAIRFAETSACPHAACCGQNQEGFGGIFRCVIQHLQHFELNKTPK